MIHTPDIRYVVALAKTLPEELGFLPICAYELARQEQRLHIQSYNDEPCGFILTARPTPGRILKIYQTAIQYDARRLQHATQLIRDLEARATLYDCPGISLKCAADLAANQFWKAMGFIPGEIIPGGRKRHRQIIPYAKRLAPHS
jgi:ribosomal protein S18 acetylase RimI-like enzyme